MVRVEELVRDLLRVCPALTMDELADRLPDVSWNQLFQVVDTLSRRGEVALRRSGPRYCIERVESADRH